MELNSPQAYPFIIKEGDSKEVALANRICAINRINFLVQEYFPDFDVRSKSKEYLLAHDLEMYKKFYEGKDQPKIDEDFCQKAAKVFIDMESPIEEKQEEKEDVQAEPVEKIIKKDGFIKKLINKLNKDKVVL